MPDVAQTALPVPSFFFSDDFSERRYKTGKNTSSSTVAKQIGPVNLKECNDLSGQTFASGCGVGDENANSLYEDHSFGLADSAGGYIAKAQRAGELGP